VKQLSNWSSDSLWIIYLALLAVLLPHTACVFNGVKPQASGWLGAPWSAVTAWAIPFSFEAVIAAPTHESAGHIK
jgi:hypothetical protein